MLRTLFLFVITLSCSQVETYRVNKKWKFHEVKIHGWTFKIESKVFRSELYPKLKNYFISEVVILNKVLPSHLKQHLQKVIIWASNESHYPFRKNEQSSAVYHVDPNWLKNQMLPEQFASGIHIINPLRHIVDNELSLRADSLLLHEVFHYFMDKCMSKKNLKVLESRFRRVKKTKLYKNVEYENEKEKKPAYALRSVWEFFAELSEAYLYKSRIYPFDKKSLEIYDLKSFLLVDEIWNGKCHLKS